jgi:hypothetical protein
MTNDELESMKYFMAAEKVGYLLLQLQMMMEFVEEYEIVADDNVKIALKPKIERLQEWIKV